MTRVPHLRHRGQRRYALLAAAVAATVVASGLTIGGGHGAVYAAENEVADAPLPTMVVAPADPVVSSDEPSFRFEVLVRNPGEEPLPAGTVSLSIDNDRATTVEDLKLSTTRAALEMARADMPEIPAGEDQLLEIDVPAADFPLLLLRMPGVYPVHAELIAEEEKAPAGAKNLADDSESSAPEVAPLVASTSLVWGGVDAAQPLQLTLVVPIVLPSSVRTLPTRAELGEHSPSLLRLVDGAIQRHATLAIDPRILAGIRALGTAAPRSALDLLERIEQSSTPMFLLQFADADPAVQAALGLEELMQPIGMDYATQLGTFEAPSTAEGDATGVDATDLAPQPDLLGDQAAAADDASLIDPITGVPTMEGLLALNNSRSGAWPAGGEVDSSTLALLQRSGLTSLVLDSTNVTNATSARVSLSGFDTLIADASLGAATHTMLAGESATDRSSAAAELSARLALGAQQGAGGTVLALDRGALADAADPLSVFELIDELSWLLPTSERQLSAGTAELRAGAPTEERRELLRATLLRSPQIDELAPLLEQPEYLLEYQRERLLESFATRYAEAGVDYSAVDAATKERDDELLHGVRPIVTESTQLVGTLTNVPVTLDNSLPFPAAIVLRADPASAGISLTKRSLEVMVPGSGSTTVVVPVRSRVSSGESGVLLEVHARSNEQLYATEFLPLTLRTAIETILVWILGASATLLLGFGILRSIRRRRVTAKAVEAAEGSNHTNRRTAQDSAQVSGNQTPSPGE